EQYLSRGDSKRALAKLQICFKANPRELGTLQMLARAFQDLGQISKTVSVLKELARVHQDAGRGDEARKTWKQAHELAPDDPEGAAGWKSVGGGESARPGAREPVRPKPPPAPPRAAPAPPKAVPPPPPPRTPPPVPVSAAPATRPPTAPIMPARPPTAPIVPARPPTAPIMGARPATAPIQTTGGSSAPVTAAQVPKLIKETEVYIKYGLHDKAQEHLKRILEADPDNIDAHEKAKMVALAMGNTAEAKASLETM